METILSQKAVCQVWEKQLILTGWIDEPWYFNSRETNLKYKHFQSCQMHRAKVLYFGWKAAQVKKSSCQAWGRSNTFSHFGQLRLLICLWLARKTNQNIIEVAKFLASSFTSKVNTQSKAGCLIWETDMQAGEWEFLYYPHLFYIPHYPDRISDILLITWIHTP